MMIQQLFFIRRRNFSTGQSVVEVLISLGVFVIGVVAVSLLVLEAGLSFRQSIERTQAILLIKEGLEATRSIRETGFDSLTEGSHGLVFSDNKWVFSGEQDVTGQFTRTIDITGIDVNTKRIESIVSWQFTESRPGSLSLISYLSDWKQTQGEAGDLRTDISGARIAEDNRELQGTTIENVGSQTVVLDKMVLWWDNSNLLYQIKIDGEKIFNASSTEGVSSGTEIDVTDFALTQASGVKNIDTFKFNGEMVGTDFLIKFIMEERSTRYVLVDL